MEINLRKEYIKLNESFKKQLIYPLTNRGFFSEINNLSLAVLYCLDNKINFKISTRNWVSGKWIDYFNPTFKEYNGLIPIPSHSVFDIKSSEKLYYNYHKYVKNRVIVQDGIWDKMRSPSFTGKNFYFPDLNINGGIFQAKQQVMELILDYNQNTINNSFNIAEDINFISSSAGIHVRRGDKVDGTNKEADIFKIQSYVKKAKAIDPDINKFTICTDDYSVVEEFKSNYPEYDFLTYCPESKKGYSQKAYNNLKSISLINKEGFSVIKDVYLLTKSKIFIGANSSSISRFVSH